MSIYQNIYDLITEFVYGGSLPVGGEQVAMLVSTACCCLVVALPFVLVYKIIKMLLG